MKKKNKIISLVIVILLGVLVVAANVWQRRQNVRDIRVDIEYFGADSLITEKQVAKQIRAKMPDLAATQLRDADLKGVQEAANKSPYLHNCQAGTSIGGAIVVYAEQRRPIVRIVAGGSEYYLDDQGYRVPTSNAGSCDVIVASGSIPDKGAKLKEVWLLAKYLDQHPEIAPLFDQIYRKPSGDLFLTPKLGNHIVEIGSVENLDDKFHNLLALYTRGLPQAGWETYSQVSVKFKGQVVCTRR